MGNVHPDSEGITYVAGENINTLWKGSYMHMLKRYPLEYFAGHCNLQAVYFSCSGLVPYDGVPGKKIVAVHLAITVIYLMLACAGILFAIACLLFNFICRNSK